MIEFLFVLIIKHVIVDLGLQAHLTGIDKKNYLGNGHKHYLHHGIATLVVALWFLDPMFALLCAIADYFLHWQIDFGKHHLNRIAKIEARTRIWWWTNTLDQLLHFTTYFVLAKMFM